MTEAIDYKSGKNVTVHKGEVLYHGTGNTFDSRSPKPSGYDDVFWTTDNIMVARSYIPESGLSTSLSLRDIISSNDKSAEAMRKNLGLTDKIKQAASKKDQEGYKLLRYWEDKKAEFAAKWKEMEKLPNYDELPGIDTFFDQWREAEENANRYRKEWKHYESYLKLFLTQKLKNLGYEVANDSVKRVKINGKDEILPADKSTVGRVLKVTCGRDFKFYNQAYGKEADLMDLDYHKVDLFRQKESEGFDGIVINDFAQTSKYGNMEHISFGFFKESLKDLQIKQIRLQTHPNDNEW